MASQSCVPLKQITPGNTGQDPGKSTHCTNAKQCANKGRGRYNNQPKRNRGEHPQPMTTKSPPNLTNMPVTRSASTKPEQKNTTAPYTKTRRTRRTNPTAIDTPLPAPSVRNNTPPLFWSETQSPKPVTVESRSSSPLIVKGTGTAEDPIEFYSPNITPPPCKREELSPEIPEPPPKVKGKKTLKTPYYFHHAPDQQPNLTDLAYRLKILPQIFRSDPQRRIMDGHVCLHHAGTRRDDG